MKKKKTDPVVEKMKTVPKSASGPRMISLKLIHPNPYNCNRMDSAELEALTKDMRDMKHPSAMDPIRVRKDGKEFEIIDGEHRFTVAKRLKWPEIACVVFEMPQDDAMLWNFRINRQRGSHDPLKEANFFRHLKDDLGLTQKRIGELLNIDPTVVGRRISFLNIDKEIMECIDPNATPVSVLEVVAQAPDKEFQDELLRDYTQYGSSVEDLQDSLMEKKEELAKEERFQETIAKAKFPECPSCGDKATAFWWTEPYVTDGKGSNHVWNPKTGKTKRQEEQKARAAEAGHPDQSRILSVFRHNLTPSDIVAKARQNFSDFAEVVFNETSEMKLVFDQVNKDGNYEDDFTLSMSSGRWGSPEIYIQSDQGTLHVVLEPKSYQSGENTKVIVSQPSPYEEGGLEKAEKLLSKLIDGKLTFKKLAKVGAKRKMKLPKTPILVQPTDKEMWELEAKEVLKALARFCNHGKHGKCKVPHEQLMCPGYNCPDCLVRAVLQEEGIWDTPAMGDSTYVNKAYTEDPYFTGSVEGGLLPTPTKLNLMQAFKNLLKTSFKTEASTGGSSPITIGDQHFVLSVSSKTEKLKDERASDSIRGDASVMAKKLKAADDKALRVADGLRKCADYEDKKYCNRCVSGNKMEDKACFVDPEGKEFGIITVCPNCDYEFESEKTTKKIKCPKCGKVVKEPEERRPGIKEILDGVQAVKKKAAKKKGAK